MSDTKKDEALDRLTKALEEYTALCPARPEPTEPPQIEPKKMWASPGSFHRGYNMTLDYWQSGSMGGTKIPVLVVPLRPADIERYMIVGGARGTFAAKLKAIGIEPIRVT